MQDQLTLRAAKLADIGQVDDLLARSYPRLLRPDYPPSMLVLALPLITKAQPGLLRSGRYFVVEDGDRVVAAGGWSPDRRTQTRGHVRHLATDPDYLRRGIARSLLKTVFAHALRHGLREMETWSTRTAVPFYAALGFEDAQEISVPLAPGISFAAVRMGRLLSGQDGQ